MIFLLRCCCLVAKLCPTLCNTMNSSTPGFPILHYLRSLLKFMSIYYVGSFFFFLLCRILTLGPIFNQIHSGAPYFTNNSLWGNKLEFKSTRLVQTQALLQFTQLSNATQKSSFSLSFQIGCHSIWTEDLILEFLISI